MYTRRRELPVSNLRSKRFELLSYPPGKETAAELAQRLGNSKLLISVPMGFDPPRMEPALPCPRCGLPEVIGVFGHGAAPRFDSIDELVVAARLMAPYTTLCLVSSDGKVTVEQSLEPYEEQVRVLWEVEADTEVIRDEFMNQLRSTLIATGSTLSPIKLRWSGEYFLEQRSM